MKLFKLRGVVQPYAWGGKTFIPNLIGASVTNDPSAEYWMGAHAKAPSEIESFSLPLNDYIGQDPKKALGERVAAHFGRLPFLFKVLDVNDMLSIQVHPTKVEAEKGFERENEAGIPLTAAHRNYKDDNHKPEIMVALGDFWLLHGFKSKEQLRTSLKNTPELSRLVPIFEEEGYQGLYQSVMEESETRTNETLQPLIDRIYPEYQKGTLEKTSPEFWAAKAYQTFCPEGNIDKGIYSIFFFNIVNVKAGEGVFQAAGVPHAYMEGQNIELMANSDNVLRGGLTPKHVDVPELLKHVAFEETNPMILQGEKLHSEFEEVYTSPAPDFELSKISLSAGKSYRTTTETMEILLVIQGRVSVQSEDTVDLGKGEVVAAVAGCTYEMVSDQSAVVYKAKAGRF